MKIVFFGSSDFALPTLRAMKEGGFAPDLVVTKPDAPRGRGRKIYPAEVRLEAEELKLHCEQPDDVNSEEFRAELAKRKPDVAIVVSFGAKFCPELLAVPRLGCINAHASLLPLYRGAAPIQHAIRDGQARTGISIMRMNEELDAGDVMLQEETPIDARETAGQLRQRLAELAGKVTVQALKLLDGGKAKFKAQDAANATRAPSIQKPDGVISWSMPAKQIDLLVRAMTPKPGAQTRLGAKRYIVMEGEVEQDLYGLGVPGLVQSAGEEGIRVCTGKDLYRIIRIKPENGRNMTAGEFVRGHAMPPDARFG
ncbi:MAG: methionyl-tRNA formyltransferase [Planctomycetota bacterium]